jgi:hypothetical protein
MKMIKYKLHKSEKSQEGLYQILECTTDFPNGLTCGIYFNKKDAIEDLKKLKERINQWPQ